MQNIALVVSLVLFVGTVRVNDAEYRAEIAFEFRRLVNLIKRNAWQELQAFVSSDTKCGFGPGEYGRGCVEQMMLKNPECKQEIIFALNQGCRIVPEKTEQIARPHLNIRNPIF